MISIKIHNSYRTVVAICDSELIGKRFEEGKRQLDLRANFYKEEERDFETTVSIIKRQIREDATFNIVGKESVKAAVAAGLVNEGSIDTIDSIPFILTLI